jgi:hypothetical protein
VRWTEELTFISQRHAARDFQIQLTYPNAQKAVLDYRVNSDGTAREAAKAAASITTILHAGR